MTRLLIAFVFLLSAAPAGAAFKVMIDPGHGGTDGGAVRGSLREADLVLKVAVKLRDLLANDRGVDVAMTRTENHSVDLPARVKMAEAARADLFVSLHANATADGRARGLELFFQNSLPADEDALYLANLENRAAGDGDASIADVSRKGDVAAIIADLHRQSRMASSLKFSRTLDETLRDAGARRVAIKQAPLYVVSRTAMPSVLVELGFITHAKEARQLANDDYQNDLAASLRDAILHYRAALGTDADVSGPATAQNLDSADSQIGKPAAPTAP